MANFVVGEAAWAGTIRFRRIKEISSSSSGEANPPWTARPVVSRLQDLASSCSRSPAGRLLLPALYRTQAEVSSFLPRSLRESLEADQEALRFLQQLLVSQVAVELRGE